MNRRTVTTDEANELLQRSESHFFDFKSAKSKGGTIQSIACQFANAEGGDFIVGIEDKRVGPGLADRR